MGENIRTLFTYLLITLHLNFFFAWILRSKQIQKKCYVNMQERRTQNLRLSVLKRHKYTQQVQITILIIALTAFKWNNGKIDIKN